MLPALSRKLLDIGVELLVPVPTKNRGHLSYLNLALVLGTLPLGGGDLALLVILHGAAPLLPRVADHAQVPAHMHLISRCSMELKSSERNDYQPTCLGPPSESFEQFLEDQAFLRS
jgi:hypothetical protein